MQGTCILVALIVAVGMAMSTGCPAPASAAVFGRYRVQTPTHRQLQVNDAARYSNSLHAGGYGYRYQRPRENRVMELPEDGDLWHFTVIPNGNQESQIVERFLSESPRLYQLATTQTMYHKLTPQHPHAARYYAYDQKPVVVLQTSSGRVIYKYSAGNVPKNAEEMADEVESAIWAYVADCGPDCKPDETTPESRVPELRKKDPSPGGGIDGGDIVAIACIVICAAGLFASFYKRS